MEIEEFFCKSEGNWRSMRSSHSLAFKQFEQVISQIEIKRLKKDEPKVTNLINKYSHLKNKYSSGFIMNWEAESDWSENENKAKRSGSSILIPIAMNNSEGLIINSQGYTEQNLTLSSYIVSEGIILIKNQYETSITEERIWFLSDNLRCRSSAVFTKNKKGVIQTSYASELKISEKNKGTS